MCVVQKPEDQYKVMLQVGRLGRWGGGRGRHLGKKPAPREGLLELGPQARERWRAPEEEVGNHPLS